MLTENKKVDIFETGKIYSDAYFTDKNKLPILKAEGECQIIVLTYENFEKFINVFLER